ncbi:hypothetical protein B0A78_03575 [Flavobacterium columnare NBRC 100251 = ATCC 23463]|uniref:hypothetical protein n=1 Tax=Flavobacterium columnare TaxID=996 RepID=UPI000BE7DE80|nr:hypothetical protein [Flavobacterium columnare]PDS26098.1 hypothetical protein B0A78_03575 [Flavobacterium columnare NBRC 100251 = ATCC 23463]QHJ72935.1 hypothetical protein [Flavobacterium phage fF4]GEM58444.1 hypothetical protein FC1_16820 [Flavobacterium columnare NBRC 100251 = ATCC 23463]
MTAIETIRNWFKTGSKPTQEQFWAWMESYWHKSEKIPINQIDGIEQVYQTINQLSQQNPRIVPVGQLQIFKVAPNSNNKVLESGDFVVGFVEEHFINATYLEGDPQRLASYGIIENFKKINHKTYEQTNY